ncbi:MAG TPA: Nramp family divalent metal transporter [Pyrinomonadaceae bacterium]|nr:Nramp family divalent metal transporter [Pyrinomonadaceae bacterium]
MQKNAKTTPKFLLKIKKFWQTLGPGLVTGASDDDPSGIATYSQAGAKFGTSLLWTALVTYPLMVSIQEMCARIGLVTEHGLTGVIKRYYSKKILYLILIVSFPSITLNIGADIAGMGAVGNLLIPQVPAFLFSIAFTAILMYSIIFWSYRKISTVLKWLCIVLFSYILIPFLSQTDWMAVIKGTFLPKFENNADYYMALVAILGTTISPYLFFWQTSMEVEEVHQKHIVLDKKIVNLMQKDVEGGMFITNIVFYFIILTTGTVLYNAGIHNIDTVEEAAQALRPLAGNMAYALFAVGVLGTGFLAIPVLSGALSYMMAEIFDWNEGLDNRFQDAKGFYITMIISLILGLLMHYIGISPIKALIYTAVLYGLTAPVLIAIILHICNNKKIMNEYTNNFWSNLFGTMTFLLMTISAFLLIYFQIKQ